MPKPLFDGVFNTRSFNYSGAYDYVTADSVSMSESASVVTTLEASEPITLNEPTKSVEYSSTDVAGFSDYAADITLPATDSGVLGEAVGVTSALITTDGCSFVDGGTITSLLGGLDTSTEEEDRVLFINATSTDLTSSAEALALYIVTSDTGTLDLSSSITTDFTLSDEAFLSEDSSIITSAPGTDFAQLSDELSSGVSVLSTLDSSGLSETVYISIDRPDTITLSSEDKTISTMVDGTDASTIVEPTQGVIFDAGESINLVETPSVDSAQSSSDSALQSRGHVFDHVAIFDGTYSFDIGNDPPVGLQIGESLNVAESVASMSSSINAVETYTPTETTAIASTSSTTDTSTLADNNRIITYPIDSSDSASTDEENNGFAVLQTSDSASLEESHTIHINGAEALTLADVSVADVILISVDSIVTAIESTVSTTVEAPDTSSTSESIAVEVSTDSTDTSNTTEDIVGSTATSGSDVSSSTESSSCTSSTSSVEDLTVTDQATTIAVSGTSIDSLTYTEYAVADALPPGNDTVSAVEADRDIGADVVGSDESSLTEITQTLLITLQEDGGLLFEDVDILTESYDTLSTDESVSTSANPYAADNLKVLDSFPFDSGILFDNNNKLDDYIRNIAFNLIDEASSIESGSSSAMVETTDIAIGEEPSVPPMLISTTSDSGGVVESSTITTPHSSSDGLSVQEDRSFAPTLVGDDSASLAEDASITTSFVGIDEIGLTLEGVEPEVLHSRTEIIGTTELVSLSSEVSSSEPSVLDEFTYITLGSSDSAAVAEDVELYSDTFASNQISFLYGIEFDAGARLDVGLRFDIPVYDIAITANNAESLEVLDNTVGSSFVDGEDSGYTTESAVYESISSAVDAVSFEDEGYPVVSHSKTDLVATSDVSESAADTSTEDYAVLHENAVIYLSSSDDSITTHNAEITSVTSSSDDVFTEDPGGVSSPSFTTYDLLGVVETYTLSIYLEDPGTDSVVFSTDTYLAVSTSSADSAPLTEDVNILIPTLDQHELAETVTVDSVVNSYDSGAISEAALLSVVVSSSEDANNEEVSYPAQLVEVTDNAALVTETTSILVSSVDNGSLTEQSSALVATATAEVFSVNTTVPSISSAALDTVELIETDVTYISSANTLDDITLVDTYDVQPNIDRTDNIAASEVDHGVEIVVSENFAVTELVDDTTTLLVVDSHSLIEDAIISISVQDTMGTSDESLLAPEVHTNDVYTTLENAAHEASMSTAEGFLLGEDAEDVGLSTDDMFTTKENAWKSTTILSSDVMVVDDVSSIPDLGIGRDPSSVTETSQTDAHIVSEDTVQLYDTSQLWPNQGKVEPISLSEEMLVGAHSLDIDSGNVVEGAFTDVSALSIDYVTVQEVSFRDFSVANSDSLSLVEGCSTIASLVAVEDLALAEECNILIVGHDTLEVESSSSLSTSASGDDTALLAVETLVELSSEDAAILDASTSTHITGEDIITTGESSALSVSATDVDFATLGMLPDLGVTNVSTDEVTAGEGVTEPNIQHLGVDIWVVSEEGLAGPSATVVARKQAVTDVLSHATASMVLRSVETDTEDALSNVTGTAAQKLNKSQGLKLGHSRENSSSTKATKSQEVDLKQ